MSYNFKMKKIVYVFLGLVVAFSCSPTNRTQPKKLGIKKYIAYYNTLFNGEQALETAINNKKKEHKDNFYAPYIRVLTTENQFGEEQSMDSKARSFFMPNERRTSQMATPIHIAAMKAQKTTAKYSVLKNGEERNKTIFDAQILLAKSYLLQNKPLEALDALNYIFTYMPKHKNLLTAKIYQAKAYADLKDYYKAEEIFAEVKENSKLRKKQAKLLSIYFAETLLQDNKKEEAVSELENAYLLNKNKVLRSRIAFLRGQILRDLGRNKEAMESFVTAYKYANDFDFEVKSQLEIAKSFTPSDDYESLKNQLETISKKGIYASRRNEFYYALGLIAKTAGHQEEALKYFVKGLKLKEQVSSDPQIRGMLYREVGKDYFDKDDFISAAAYYDSALTVMSYRPIRTELESISKNLKKFTKNYYLIKKNDSILALTKMSRNEQEAFFEKKIKLLREQEGKEERQRLLAERNKGFDEGDYNANSVFNRNKEQNIPDYTSTKGSFYFANQSVVSKGKTTFKQVWRNRALADNWRYSQRMQTIEDTKNTAMGRLSTKDPRRFEASFYIEKIPTDKEKILALKKDRDTASLGLGLMYENLFAKTDEATKTLFNLVESQPEDDVKLQALYHIFAMNYKKNPQPTERAKSLILRDFPNTPYAEYVKSPLSNDLSSADKEVEKVYQEAYQLYKEEKFEQAKTKIEKIISKQSDDTLMPKLELLQAFIVGKMAGKNELLSRLQQIALSYPNTEEGKRAVDLLKSLGEEKKEKPKKEKKPSLMEHQQMQEVQLENDGVDVDMESDPLYQ